MMPVSGVTGAFEPVIPPRQPEAAPAEVRRALATLAERTEKLRAARAWLLGSHDRIESAKQADHILAVAAARNGDPTPAATHETTAVTERDTATRSVSAAEAVARESEEALIATVREHAGAWQDAIAVEASGAEQAIADAQAALRAGLLARGRCEVDAQWVTSLLAGRPAVVVGDLSGATDAVLREVRRAIGPAPASQRVRV